MSRLQDSVIDDDEETCPLCIEEFDISDKNFTPCPCGYKICQFCFNSLKTTYEKSTCPNCRRLYDEKTIQYKIPTAEEFKLDLQAKNRKQAAAKRKEIEKKEVETSSRRNLAGVRVKQQNLVYVIGLVPDLKDEPKLLQTLRGKEYFGQYGEIEKIVVSKAKPGVTSQGVGVYVTFARKEDAALCINAIDGSKNEDRVLRAQYGTTKYCSAYLRGEDCNNKNCSFLHETGEDGQDTTLQNEQINRVVSRPGATSQTQVQPISRPTLAQSTPSSQQMARQSSSDKEDSRKGSSVDSSALPSSAGWAATNASGQPPKSRRASQVAGRPSPSPQISGATLANRHTEDSKQKDMPTSTNKTPQNNPLASTQTSISSASSTSQNPVARSISRSTSPDPHRGFIAKISGNMGFSFNESMLTPEDMAAIKRMPKLIDPCGGLKLRIRKDREAAEQAKYETELQSNLQLQEQAQTGQLPIDSIPDDENIVAGSFALGGEPEEDVRSASARGTIQRPSQSTSTSNFVNEAFANMNGSGRSLTPQQRGQLGLPRAPSQQVPSIGQTAQNLTGTDAFDYDRRAAQYQSQTQYDSISSHQRHPSRYFNSSENSKSNAASRYQGQPSFYTSGVQGPPPGLKTAGTPPINGGSMFAHGQGFTSNVNTTFSGKDATIDMFSRGRSVTGSGHDASKRGGVVDHADPNPLQSRANQSGASTGQGLFSGQNQGDEEFPPLPAKRGQPSGPFSRVSSVQGSLDLGRSTPKLPPGLDISHAHPEQVERKVAPTEQTRSAAPVEAAGPVTPAVPLLSLGPVASPAMSAVRDNMSQPKAPVAASEAVKSRDQQATSPAFATDDLASRPFKSKTEKGASEIKSETIAESPVKEAIRSKIVIEGQVASKASIDVSKTKMLDLAATPAESVSQEVPLEATPLASSEVVGSPLIIGSRPATPATTGSETPSKTSTRPRTIRVITSIPQKGELVPTPGSAVTERSAPISASAHSKQRSRQPSVSSMSRSRPSTPAMSEALSYDFSRASSPPPGIVGSAPERTSTKAQQRKQRKSKKTAEPTEDTSGVANSTPVEQVAPVVARQRKQKKRVESSAVGERTSHMRANEAKDNDEGSKISSRTKATQKETSNAVGKPEVEIEKDAAEVVTKPKQSESKNSSVPATPKEPDPETPVLEQPPRPPYTLRDLYTEAAKHPESPQLFQSLMEGNISSINKIFASLLSTKEIEQDSSFFYPPPLSSYRLPADPRRGNDYLDGNGYTDSNPFGMIYLTQDKKRAIQNGHAVRISDANKPNDLLRRAMMSPTGTVYRHLSESEEERVLELEERREMFIDEWGSLGLGLGLTSVAGMLEEDDYMNLEGGMEELARNGEAHGVSWVMQDGDEDDDGDGDGDGNQSIGQPFGMAEDDDPASDDDTDDLGLNEAGVWAAAQALGTVPKNAHITNQANVLPPMRTVAPSASANVNLRSMDAERLQKRIAETQREVDAARKDLERVDKSWTKKSREVGKWVETMMKV